MTFSSSTAHIEEWIVDYHAKLQAHLKARKPPEGEHQEHERVIVTPIP